MTGPVHLLHYADVENAFDKPERVGRLSGTIDTLRDDATIVTGGGDNTAPGVLSLATQGTHARLLFDVIEPDLDTFGNHDFDHGFDAIRETIRETPQQWLTANLELDGERFAAADTTPTTTIETPVATVGFIGVSTPVLVDINPVAEPLVVTDPLEAVEEYVPELRRDGADYVVVISHCGVDVDREIAETPGVDAVLGGHDHERLEEFHGDTLLAHPGHGRQCLLDVTLSPDGHTTTHHEVADFEPDTELVGLVEAEMVHAGLTDVVAHWKDPVSVSKRARKSPNTALGNMVADALRWDGDADVGLLVGGIREEDPLVGDITAADLTGLVPYGNDTVVVDVDGATLKEALREASFTYTYPEAPEWWFGHVSGARIVWDDRDQTLIDATVDGDTIRDDERYEVATSDYFVHGDNLVTAFDETDVVRTCGGEHESIVEYVRKHPERPVAETRVEQPYLDTKTVPSADD